MKLGAENLLCVAPSDVAAVWPIVSHFIDEAYHVMDLPTPDVLTWLLEEKGLLWVIMVDGIIHAACTSSLVAGRRGRVCRVVACGGQGIEWESCIAAMEQYARAEGCYKVAFDGRLGWGRMLPGYSVKYVCFEKRI